MNAVPVCLGSGELRERARPLLVRFRLFQVRNRRVALLQHLLDRLLIDQLMSYVMHSKEVKEVEKRTSKWIGERMK